METAEGESPAPQRHQTTPRHSGFGESAVEASEKKSSGNIYSSLGSNAFINHILKGRMCFSYSLPRSINF